MRQNHLFVRAAALLLSVCVLLLCAWPCFAVSPDLTRPGIIRFRILSDYDPVPGGDLLLVRVAEPEIDAQGNVRYVWVPELAALPFDPMDAASYENAAAVLEEVKKAGLTPERRWVDSAGKASFEQLKPGLYLFYQTQAPVGFGPLAPFVVSLPMRDRNGWSYDVEVSPKPPVKPKPPVPSTEPTATTEPTMPTEPTEPTEPTAPHTVEPPSSTEPTEPTKPVVTTTEPTTGKDETTTRDHTGTEPPEPEPSEPELPKTGQLKWPVAAFAGAGGLLIALGLVLRKRESRDEDTP